MSEIRIGEMQGGLTDRVERIASVWRGAGFNTNAFGDIDQLIWEKFVVNCTFSGPCTLFDRNVREMMEDPYAWGIALRCAREAYDTGCAKGVKFSFDDPEAYVTAFGEKMPEAKPSVLQDHLARRLSEIDAINGMVPIVAEQVGTHAPFNELVTAVVKSKERAYGGQ